MAKYELADSAIVDLDRIWTFIFSQSRNPSVADRVLDEIYGVCAKLSEYPQLGHVRPDLTSKPIRFWSVYRYLIVYEEQADQIEIARVLHGAQDLPSILNDS